MLVVILIADQLAGFTGRLRIYRENASLLTFERVSGGLAEWQAPASE
jgi:hypothetical protein